MDAWISVAERLPDEDAGEVIVCCDRGGRRLVLPATFSAAPERRDHPFRTADGGPDGGVVTHWMPYPEPPGRTLRAQPEFVRDSDTAGAIYEVRCPRCQDTVRLAQEGWWSTACACGHVWTLEIRATGQAPERGDPAPGTEE